MTKHPFLEFDSQEQKEKLIFLDDQRLLQRVVRSNLGTYFFFVENSRRFVGKIRWDSKSHRKIPHTCTGKKYGNIYGYLPRYRVSQRLFDGKFVET